MSDRKRDRTLIVRGVLVAVLVILWFARVFQSAYYEGKRDAREETWKACRDIYGAKVRQ